MGTDVSNGDFASTRSPLLTGDYQRKNRHRTCQALVSSACGLRMAKILESTEGPRFSMMDVEDEDNHMRAAFGLRHRIG